MDTAHSQRTKSTVKQKKEDVGSEKKRALTARWPIIDKISEYEATVDSPIALPSSRVEPVNILKHNKELCKHFHLEDKILRRVTSNYLLLNQLILILMLLKSLPCAFHTC